MIVALHSVLREGTEADYDREHRTVWPELADSLQRAGIDDWRIWRSGLNLFHLIETSDFDGAMLRLADDPVNERWQQHINVLVDHFETGADGQTLQFVWSLAAQVLATS